MVSIAQVTVEHHHDGFGVSTATPRLSWRFNSTTMKNWRQASYDLSIKREKDQEECFHIESDELVLVPWPSTPLKSREQVRVRVRAHGQDGSSTEWAGHTVEAALLEGRPAWKAQVISPPAQTRGAPKRPFRVRKSFSIEADNVRARLYATAHGLYEIEINGQRVGDQVLSPGWQSYHHRLHYQIYNVSDLLRPGINVIGAYIGEGWFATRLGRPGTYDIFGDRLGFLGQLEVDGAVVCATDASWEYLDGPLELAEIYNGEIYDSRLEDAKWATNESKTKAIGYCEELPFPTAELVAPDVAPVRRVMERQATAVIHTPSGKTVLDFGQNLVGWLRLEQNISQAKAGDELILRHAEVLEHGEMGMRPLRTAKCTDVIRLGGNVQGYEPRFTFHGFRYAEVSIILADGKEQDISKILGSDEDIQNLFTAVIISSDLRRTGSFSCSHAMLNQLHENTVWSMRGNFVSVPTDCPQRDERLGWTGDLQVFAPTANFLFDTTAFLASWLQDAYADQKATGTGVVPIVVPAVPAGRNLQLHQNHPMAVWADCAVLTPWDVFQTSGDRQILEAQWDSIRLWLDQGVPRDPDTNLYSHDLVQYGDWLDPRAPPSMPGHGPTDALLVADAYLVHVTARAAEIAKLLSPQKEHDQKRYSADAAALLRQFRGLYVSPRGRLVSDTQAAYVLALRFGLLGSESALNTAKARLDWLTRWEAFRITTGFAGTPIILQTLADNGMLALAYRMLQERDCPSWLYPVSMGATTIWERWNSMLPDGTINPGQMTSFNHYALGSVYAFLHTTVGGLAPEQPGWKRALIRPRPGGTVRHADTSFDSPLGPYSVRWRIAEEQGEPRLVVDISVPPNGEAHVVLGEGKESIDEVIGSGVYHYEVPWTEDPAWPPSLIQDHKV